MERHQLLCKRLKETTCVPSSWLSSKGTKHDGLFQRQPEGPEGTGQTGEALDWCLLFKPESRKGGKYQSEAWKGLCSPLS